MSRAITTALVVFTFRAQITPAIHTLLVTTVRTVFRVITVAKTRLGSSLYATLMTLPVLLDQLVASRMPSLDFSAGSPAIITTPGRPTAVANSLANLPALSALPMTVQASPVTPALPNLGATEVVMTVGASA